MINTIEQSFTGTKNGLDKIIEAFRHAGPPTNPYSKFYFTDGSVVEANISGEMDARYKESVPAPAVALSAIELGTNVTSIGYQAFRYCQSLVSVSIPNSVLSVGNLAFAACNHLSNIVIPDSVTNIGNSTFSGCDRLSSVTFGNSVSSIGNTAFQSCNVLSSVTIPQSVTNLGNGAFSGCPTTVTFEGKTKAEVQEMDNFRWQIEENKIVCTDGTL